MLSKDLRILTNCSALLLHVEQHVIDPAYCSATNNLCHPVFCVHHDVVTYSRSKDKQLPYVIRILLLRDKQFYFVFLCSTRRTFCVSSQRTILVYFANNSHIDYELISECSMSPSCGVDRYVVKGLHTHSRNCHLGTVGCTYFIIILFPILNISKNIYE